MGDISRRAADITESATLAITRRAAELRGEGAHVIGFGAGEPDFPTPDAIVSAAINAAGDVKNHKYTPAAGLPELRAAIAGKTLRDSGYEVDPAHVIVTNGGKHAVFSSCQVLLDPGDDVLLPAPYWVTYPEAVKLAGASPVVVPTTQEEGFQVSVAALDAARTERTKMLIFVSPSNPTGAVYPPDQVAAIGAWAAEHGIWVLTDEIYEHLVYGSAVFSSLAVQAPEAKVVVVNGVAKTYAMTGWRVGWLIGPPEVSAAAGRLQSHMTSNVSNLAQRAALAAVSGPLDAVMEMREAFDRRRRTMVTMLNDIEGVVCSEPEGAFYAFPSVAGLLGREWAGRHVASSLDLAAVLLDEIQVAVVPGDPFGAPGFVRFSFALSDDDLAEGLGRFQAFVAAG